MDRWDGDGEGWTLGSWIEAVDMWVRRSFGSPLNTGTEIASWETYVDAGAPDEVGYVTLRAVAHLEWGPKATIETAVRTHWARRETARIVGTNLGMALRLSADAWLLLEANDGGA